MLIDKKIVLDIEKTTQCPIMEMFYTPEDNRWYVCFDEDIVIKGKNQIVHIDDVLKEIKKYDNIENIVNEIYEGNEEDSYFEQVTFQWKEPEKEIYNQCKDCIYHETSWNIFDFHNRTDYCQIHQTEFANINENDIRFCKEFRT
ncbi:MAG: hypothetical protein J6J36_08215 [Clostridia bacterium]|nr:hypothetical protein [Clostridia bacterium]MBP3708558.1 hypothetical protein [Clostridia bacterium]